MSGEPIEGVVPAEAAAALDGPAVADAPAPPKTAVSEKPAALEDAPRPARTVPRPTPAGAGPAPASLRKSTLQGASEPPVATPAPVGDAPPPPKLPEIDAALAATDEPPSTERRSSAPPEEPVEGPPEIQRFLSPLPPPPRAESPSMGEGSGTTRRRSRRTVKIPDDAVPHKAAPAAAEPVSTPSPVSAPTSAPSPVSAVSPVSEKPASAEKLATSDKVPMPVIPPAPPVPVLSPRAAVPRPAAKAVEEASKPAAQPVVDDNAKTTEMPAVAPLAADAVETFEVIRPMRIISIGSQPPPGPAPAAAEEPPAVDAGWEEPRRISRPPLPASPELDAFVGPPPPAVPQAPAAPPPPKPPAVEEVEAIEDDEPEAAAAAPAPRTEEIESIPDDEIVPERISSAEEIAVDVVEAPPPKKPPPPPPKRAAADAPTSTPVPATPPLAAAAPAAAAAASGGHPLAQTLDLGGRKRQKPWWEEVFSDDFLRTMEKVEPKVVRKECDFIEDRLGLEKGAVMLDLACGPGTHAVELSSRGYNVVGYDLSLAMLARAQDEALDRGQKINFLQGDMREMAFEEAFDGIYCWNTSFGYFDDEKNLNVLSRIRRGLRQGGLFLLDVANRDYVCPRQPSLVWFEGDGCVCMDEMHVDFFSSRLRVKRTVMFEDGRARECDYTMRLYGLHELGKMLHETGFKVVEVTGHPAHPGVFFGSESPRIIVLAERA